MAYGSEDSNVIGYPEGPEDSNGILTYLEHLAESSRGWKYEVDRTAMRNVLYTVGIQWITYDASLQSWRPMGIRKAVPRPVTNKVLPLLNNTIARLIKFRPPITYRPGGHEASDVVAAGVAEDVIRVITSETGVRQLKPIAARWLGSTGNVFLVNGYDASPDTGYQFLAHEQCVECGGIHAPDKIEDRDGLCPGCNKPGPYQPAKDEAGVEVGDLIPRGRHYTEVHPLFSCNFDPESLNIRESPFFLVSETVPEDTAIQMWGVDNLEGVAREEGSGSDAISNYFMQSLAYTVGHSEEVYGTKGGRKTNRVRVRRLWLKPRYDKAPDGIYATILGQDRIVEQRDWPYKDKEGRKFLNVVHIKFDDRQGSLIGRTRMDDLIPKQDERNLVESHFLLHTRRMSNAAWLVPTGSGIQKLTGETGPVYSYNAIPGAPPPTRVAGVNPPEFLIRWMDIIDQEMDILWGTYEIGRGQVPERGSDLAFVSLQMLAEKAEEAQSTITENWAVGWMEWSNQHLNIWREYATAERTVAIGGGQWAVEKFNKAKLEGGVDIDVEIGNFRPRSHITMRGTLQQLFNMGIVNPADPQMAFKIYQLFGMPELMEDYRLDWTQANQENDLFKDFAQGIQKDPMAAAQFGQAQQQDQMMGAVSGMMGMPPEAAMAQAQATPLAQPQPWETHMVHIFIHRQFLMSDFFRALPPPLQQPFLMHMQMHMMFTQGAGPAPGGKEEQKGEDTTNTEAQQGGQSPEATSGDNVQQEVSG